MKILIGGMMLLSLVLVPTTVDVQASAEGCTSAPGAIGAQNCIDLEGIQTYVSYVDSGYSAGFAAVNVCNPSAKFKYMRSGTSAYAFTYKSASTCGWWKGWVGWNNPGWMKNGSSFCATQVNSVINTYPNYACVGIKG